MNFLHFPILTYVIEIPTTNPTTVMKKIYLALMCIVTLATVVACGEKKAKAITGDEQVDQQLEQAEKAFADMTDIEKCEATWAKRYQGKLTLADVQPDFEFTEKLRGLDSFQGNGENLAKAVYVKKDSTDITPEEWTALVTKVYNATLKLADDGKIVRGFGTGLDVKTREQALEERSLQQILEGGNNLEWAFLRNDQFEACFLTLEDGRKPNYVAISIGLGLQKNLDAALEDAEQQLK